MHVARLLPASIVRAFRLLAARFLAVFADTPVFFFAVVIGVALTFRFAASAVRDASTPALVAPTFVTGAEPGLAEADAAARAAKAQAEARAASDALEQTEARAAKPRRHGRRPAR